MTRPRFELGIIGMARLECCRYGKSPVITCTFYTVKNPISPCFLVPVLCWEGQNLDPRTSIIVREITCSFCLQNDTDFVSSPPSPHPPHHRLLSCTSSSYLRSMPMIVVMAFRHSSRPICKRTIAIIIKAIYVGEKQRFSLV